MNHRTSNSMQTGDHGLFPNGYAMLDFPSDLQARLRDHVLNFIDHTVPSGTLDGTRSDRVLSLSDSDYVTRFRKGYRTFPDKLSHPLRAWAQSALTPLLRANELDLTYVCDADRAVNPALSAESYDVYWRIARPNKPDVGAPHTDLTFARLNAGGEREIPLPFDFTARWRLWIPLYGCTQHNSLQFIQGSQFEHFPAELRDTPAGPRPSVSPEWIEQNEHRFECPFRSFEGTAVLFPDTVIHRGPMNHEQDLRLSADFTVIVR